MTVNVYAYTKKKKKVSLLFSSSWMTKGCTESSVLSNFTSKIVKKVCVVRLDS